MKRRVLRLALAALIVATLGVILILATGLGPILIQRILPSNAPGLSVGAIEGRIAGELRLRDIRYESAGVSVRIESAVVNTRLFGFVSGGIAFRQIQAAGVTVVLHPDPDAKPSSAPDLPALDLAQIEVTRGSVQLADGQRFAIDRLTGAMRGAGTGLELRDLNVSGPHLSARGDLTLNLAHGLPTAARLSVAADWRGRRYVGLVTASSARERVHLLLDLNEPLSAKLDANYASDEPSQSWRASVVMPPQSPAILPEALRGAPVAASISAEASGKSITLAGSVTLLEHTLALSDTTLSRENGAVLIERMTLTDTAGAGALNVAGRLPTGDGAVALELLATAVKLPRGNGQYVALDGRTALSGTWRELVVQPELQLTSAPLPPAALRGRAVVADDAIVLDGISLSAEHSVLRIDGRIPRVDDQPWHLTIHATAFDPALLLADWNGQLDADLAITASAPAEGDIEVQIERLQGTLRGRPIQALGQINLVAWRPQSADLEASSGSARLKVQGGDAKNSALTATLQAPDLGDLAPGWRGALHAQAIRRDAQHTELTIDADHIVVGTYVAASARAHAEFGEGVADPFDATITVTDAVLAGQSVDSLTLAARGRRAAHEVALQLQAGASSLDAALSAALIDAEWSGRITKLSTKLQDGSAQTLRAPAAFGWSTAAWSLQTLCLTQADGDACIDGSGEGSAGHAALSLRNADPAPWLALAAPSAPTLRARLDGDGKVAWSEGAITDGEIRLRSTGGKFEWRDHAEVELGYNNLLIDGSWRAGLGSVKLQAGLLPQGRVDAQIDYRAQTGGGPQLSGHIDAELEQLAWLESLSADLGNVQGRVSARLAVAGTASEPSVSGSAELSDFAADIAELGIRVEQGKVAITANGERRFEVVGSAVSGAGKLELTGRWAPGAADALSLSLRGERVLVSDTETAKIYVSPALELRQADAKLAISGSLGVPEARIDLTRLESASTRSADVVVIDDPPATGRQMLPWNARIEVVLGKAVKLQGFGFDGTVAGTLAVRQRSTGDATATGALDLAGRYNAYGQKLNITRGRLLYAGSALGNPTLDIRAERAIREVTAGVNVSGPARRPILSVYARPAMSDSDALALLITGRPLRDASDADRSRLGSAATALGTVGGDMLAHSLGGGLGLDEIGVSSDTAIEGAAFTFGKYLTPRLYVGYGVGLLTSGQLFTARFQLTEHFELEANSGARNRAAVNYRIER